MLIILIILHCAAMDAAMLFDDTAAVDGHYLAVGEDGGNALYSCLVVRWLIVCRDENSTIYNKVVGIGGRQLGAVLVQYGVG